MFQTTNQEWWSNLRNHYMKMDTHGYNCGHVVMLSSQSLGSQRLHRKKLIQTSLARCFSSFCAIRLPRHNQDQSSTISSPFNFCRCQEIVVHQLALFSTSCTAGIKTRANFVGRLLINGYSCVVSNCVLRRVEGPFHFCCWWTSLLVSFVMLIAFFGYRMVREAFETRQPYETPPQQNAAEK